MDDRHIKTAVKARFRELAFRTGIRAITIDMIARDCGISKKTLYLFFRSKDDLVEAILEDMLAEYNSGVKTIDASVKDPLDKLYRLIELPFALFGEISTQLAKDVTLLYPHIEKRLDTLRNTHRKTVMNNYVDGVRAGYFKDINPTFVESFLSGAGRQVMSSAFVLENNMTLRQIFTYFRDIMLSGLLKKNGPAAKKKKGRK